MQRIRIRKNVNIDSLKYPSPEIILDDLSRVETLKYTYKSIVVTYSVLWQGLTNILGTYTQSIQDKPNV